MTPMLSSARRCFLNHGGAALIEFAVVFPFIALLLYGAIEMARYVLITQKVERAGYVLGDTVSQHTEEQLTMTALNNVFQQYYTMMNPYGSGARQAVIISSVIKDPADKQIKIAWQYAGGGVLNNDKTVSIVSGKSITATGTVRRGDVAAFSGDTAAQLVTMLDNENMIVAEVFFQYEPVLSRILSATTAQAFNVGPRTLVRRTFFHPRNGDLLNPPSSSSSSGGASCTPCYEWDGDRSTHMCGWYVRADCTRETDMEPCDGSPIVPPSGWASCTGIDPCERDGKGSGCLVTDSSSCIGVPTSDGRYCCAGCSGSSAGGSSTSSSGTSASSGGSSTSSTSGGSSPGSTSTSGGGTGSSTSSTSGGGGGGGRPGGGGGGRLRPV